MGFLQRFTVGQRIGVAFAILGLLVLAGGVQMIFIANGSMGVVSNTRDSLLLVRDVADLQQSWNEVAANIDSILVTQQSRLGQNILNENLAAFNEQLNLLVETDSEVIAANDEFIGRVAVTGNELNKLVGEFNQLALAGDWPAAQLLRDTQMRTLQLRFDRAASDLSAQLEQNANQAVAAAADNLVLVRIGQVAMTLVTAVVAVLMGLVLVRSIVAPVRQLTTGAERLAAGRLGERVQLRRRDEFGQLADAFNTMAAQLQQYYGELEQRVADRTQALHTVTEVSRHLSTILNEQELTKAVVSDVQGAFDYYHVHIYLFDDKKEYLEMVGGTGQPAREMLARQHRLEVGQGLVGRAAAKKSSVLVPDVTRDPNWLPNPLLPETKSEVAVPIAFGSEVFGVLDVQQNRIGGVEETDVELLESVASQVAIALQNARLVSVAQDQAEQATVVNTIGQKIQRATTVEDVLRVAASELGQMLEVESARIKLDRTALSANGRGDRR